VASVWVVEAVVDPVARPQPAEADDEPGLRERKKEATRQALSDAALRLFVEVGFEETTVEAIAAAVHVAPRTFHRYFPRKEDVLFADAARRVETLRTALASRPADEPLLTSLRAGVGVVFDDLVDQREHEIRRSAVLQANPVVRAAHLRYLDEWSAVLAHHVASREGMQASDAWPSLVARCAVAAASTARTQWIERGGDLASLMDETFAMLARLGAAHEDVNRDARRPDRKPR
jgi:AcrR family transcriptional regulator